MKLYYYSYTITLPNLKEENREYITTKVNEIIDIVSKDKDKYYISNQKVIVFENGKEVEINKVLNPF